MAKNEFPKVAVEYGDYLMTVFGTKELAIHAVSLSEVLFEELVESTYFASKQALAIGNRLNKLNEVKLYLQSL